MKRRTVALSAVAIISVSWAITPAIGTQPMNPAVLEEFRSLECASGLATGVSILRDADSPGAPTPARAVQAAARSQLGDAWSLQPDQGTAGQFWIIDQDGVPIGFAHLYGAPEGGWAVDSMYHCWEDGQ